MTEQYLKANNSNFYRKNKVLLRFYKWQNKRNQIKRKFILLSAESQQ